MVKIGALGPSRKLWLESRREMVEASANASRNEEK